MRGLALFAFLGMAWAANAAGLKEELRFELLSTRSDKAPEIRVHFANGISDNLVLERYILHPEKGSNTCSYIGQLENHASSAAVTGCLEKPGDRLDITLLSEHNQRNTMFTVDLEGNMDVIENPLKEDGSSIAVYPTLDRDGGFHVVHGVNSSDEVINDDLEAAEIPVAAALNGNVPYPAKMKATLQFGTESFFRKKLAESQTSIKNWLESTMAHTQAKWKHPSLKTQVIFEVAKDYLSAVTSQPWRSDDNINDARLKTSENNPNDLVAWWTLDPYSYSGTIGIAYLGTACDLNYKTSLNEWRKTYPEAGHVLAHEIGHNLGMEHDFDKKHKGKKCTGIMDYGDPPASWSKCSVSDFAGHYKLRKWGQTCFDDLTSGGGGVTPKTTPKPKPKPSPAACKAKGGNNIWAGDKYCDDQNNIAECGYDKGDCCPPHKTTGWKDYCVECKCKKQ